jgi:hypothetical protein
MDTTRIDPARGRSAFGGHIVSTSERFLGAVLLIRLGIR